VNSRIRHNSAFWIAPNGNHYFIGAQYSEDTIDSIETLRNVPITGSTSKQPIPLRNVASFYRATGPAVIKHVNITRTIDIYSNVASGYDVGTVASDIEARLIGSDLLALTPLETPRGLTYKIGGQYDGKGYSMAMRGEVHSMRKSFKQFAQGLVIAVILVYLAMVAQLRSFTIPFIILLSVPLGLIGVALILFVTRTNLSIPAFMGLIMMTGIVVEYSIILVDFANQRVREGRSVLDAIKEATWIRLRPILMTSLTTWLALIPMAIGLAGGEANAPLARTIIGGVLAATVLSLVVIPCLYVMVRRDETPSPAAVPAGG